MGHVGFADPFDEKIAKVYLHTTTRINTKLTLNSRS